MIVLTKGIAARIAAVATALVVGPATLAPGTAEAPAPTRAALAGDGATAAQSYHWRTMLWDFAWEFGESLDSRPYRGTDTDAGRWVEYTDGTGRVVKYGGGIEFHSGDKHFERVGPDKGTTTLTLLYQPAKRGRWEIRERAERSETNGANYRFLIELVPDDPAGYDCGAHNLTIAEVQPGASSVKIGVNAGTRRWSKSFTGYPQRNDNYAFAVQITAKRITWFINGKAVAGLGAAAAIPQVPMTLRLSLVGAGAKEMNKSVVKLDWVRAYNLLKGDPARTSVTLTEGRYGGAC
jgi:hypothetical protein